MRGHGEKAAAASELDDLLRGVAHVAQDPRHLGVAPGAAERVVHRGGPADHGEHVAGRRRRVPLDELPVDAPPLARAFAAPLRGGAGEHVDHAEALRVDARPRVQDALAYDVLLPPVAEEQGHVCRVAGRPQDGVEGLEHRRYAGAAGQHCHVLLVEGVLHLHVRRAVLELKLAADRQAVEVPRHGPVLIDLHEQLERPDHRVRRDGRERPHHRARRLGDEPGEDARARGQPERLARVGEPEGEHHGVVRHPEALPELGGAPVLAEHAVAGRTQDRLGE
mmetsp:Transcript_118636/g.336345  ORF Transcript_118636/g.336345 Transcript_118636/m.336345 type:complete len:279 (-) Transcript_118636:144-980(-)